VPCQIWPVFAASARWRHHQSRAGLVKADQFQRNGGARAVRISDSDCMLPRHLQSPCKESAALFVRFSSRPIVTATAEAGIPGLSNSIPVRDCSSHMRRDSRHFRVSVVISREWSTRMAGDLVQGSPAPSMERIRAVFTTTCAFDTARETRNRRRRRKKRSGIDRSYLSFSSLNIRKRWKLHACRENRKGAYLRSMAFGQ